MPDDSNIRGGRDRERVSAEQKHEVDYLQRQFPSLSQEEIIEAIRQTGPDRDSVMEYLSKKSK
jgi:hypothetical protein